MDLSFRVFYTRSFFHTPENPPRLILWGHFGTKFAPSRHQKQILEGEKRIPTKKTNKGGPSGNLSKCVSKCSLSPLKNLESRNSAQGLGVPPSPQKKRQQEQRKIRKSETLHCVPRRHGGGLYIATLLSEHTTCQPHYRKRRRKTEQQDNYMKIIVFPSEITITSRWTVELDE